MEKKFERVKKRKADTPMRAIRAKCYDCCCDQANEIRLCPSKDCPLWKYRFGRRPKVEE